MGVRVTSGAVRVPKLWGEERIYVNDHGYCMKELRVKPSPVCCSVHYHLNKTETFIMRSGRLAIEVYELKPFEGGDAQLTLEQFSPPVTYWLAEDDCLTLQPFMAHRFWCMGNLPAIFIEVSTLDDPEDSCRIIKSGDLPPHLAERTAARFEWERLNPPNGTRYN